MEEKRELQSFATSGYVGTQNGNAEVYFCSLLLQLTDITFSICIVRTVVVICWSGKIVQRYFGKH